jgi:membrane protein DedA with SNARE-associated domain
MRRAFRRALLAGLARIGIGPERVEALATRLRRTGARGVAVARMTPGVRVGAIAACSMAAIPFAVFLRGLIVGNAVFVTGHFALGYLLGASATEVIGSVSGIGLIAIALSGLALIGAVGWGLLRRARRAPPGASSGFGAWADAACPACLAIAVAATARPASD